MFPVLSQDIEKQHINVTNLVEKHRNLIAARLDQPHHLKDAPICHERHLLWMVASSYIFILEWKDVQMCNKKWSFDHKDVWRNCIILWSMNYTAGWRLQLNNQTNSFLKKTNPLWVECALRDLRMHLTPVWNSCIITVMHYF